MHRSPRLSARKSVNPPTSAGDHVEDGESEQDAALRQLTEEAGHEGRIDCWTGPGGTTAARPRTSTSPPPPAPQPCPAPEAHEHSPDNSFGLLWATPADFTPPTSANPWRKSSARRLVKQPQNFVCPCVAGPGASGSDCCPPSPGSSTRPGYWPPPSPATSTHGPGAPPPARRERTWPPRSRKRSA